jgi:antitoxin (DNA-binding transcriptional repressor) of toxin-antitoxin stability system
MSEDTNGRIYSIEEARERLPELVARALAGETVQIAGADGATVALGQRENIAVVSVEQLVGTSSPSVPFELRLPLETALEEIFVERIDVDAIRQIRSTQPYQQQSAGEFMRDLRNGERF